MLPTVVLFTDFNILSLNLSEALLAKQCRVVVLTDDLADWKTATKLLSENENLKIFSTEKNFTEDVDYFLLVAGFGPTSVFGDRDLIKKGLNFYQDRPAKALAVLPIKKREHLISAVKDGIHRVYLAEVFGPRMTTQMPTLDGGEPIIFAPDAANELVRNLFSYGGESEVVIKHAKDPTPGAVELTLEWLSKNKTAGVSAFPVAKPETPSLRQHKPRSTPGKSNRRFWTIGLAAAILAAVSPFMLLLCSVLFLKLSQSSLVNGEQERARGLIVITDYLALGGGSVAAVPAKIPLLGVPYGYGRDLALLIRESVVVARRLLQVQELVRQLTSGIITETEYDIVQVSRQLAVELTLIYQESSFLESEIERMPAARDQLDKIGVDLAEMRRMALESIGIIKRLPVLLGEENPKTYLILFQNNMELRPTGGFIGSFALASFGGGKLTNVEFFDVYSADGQLKGHIEPPAPIRDHLGEASWYLRDSNWDPDFATSAERAEWFLDKELDRSVDGVVGIDLEVAKSLLKMLGPVKLADFGMEVDHKNVYEKVQYQVESTFFPGSQTKKNILTALGRAILEKLKTEPKINYPEFGSLAFDSLRGRHVQFFLHDGETQKSIAELGYAGDISEASCVVINCRSILAGLVEANVGVNKANYFITRTVSLSSFVSTKSIENTLTVEYKNNAPAAIGISGRYKNYVRLLADGDAKVKQVGLIEAGGTKILTPDLKQVAGRLEAGVLVDVGPGQKKSIRFTWSVPASLTFATNGEVNYVIRKQAGTAADAFYFKVGAPVGVDFVGQTSYNTILNRDQTKKVIW